MPGIVRMTGRGYEIRVVAGFCLTFPSVCSTVSIIIVIITLTVIASFTGWALLMVKVAVFPELEPENMSGIPEGCSLYL